MLSKISVEFLKDLEKNNNREWFQANKSRFEAAKSEFLVLVSGLIGEMNNIDPEIGPVNPKDTVFRIYRDVRFSKNKSPYKNNMGTHLIKGGKKSGNAGYYFHLEPGASFAGGGIWQPMPDKLKIIRNEIYDNIDEFKSIIGDKNFKTTFGEISGDRLKTPPKGFPKDFPDIDLLKFKSFTVFKNIPDNMLLSKNLTSEISAIFKQMYPFNRFINFAFQPE